MQDEMGKSTLWDLMRARRSPGQTKSARSGFEQRARVCVGAYDSCTLCCSGIDRWSPTNHKKHCNLHMSNRGHRQRQQPLDLPCGSACDSPPSLA